MIVPILLLLLIVGFLRNTATAAEIVGSGYCGEDGTNLTWTLNSEGTLTISGTGAMKGYSSGKYVAPWYKKRSMIKTATIADNITSIGSYAFYECSNLTSVKIPDAVTSIGSSAFSSCSSLTSVEIPDAVTSIGGGAFSFCSSLTSVEIPDAVTSIKHGMFQGCSGLTSVKIPDTVTSIESEAFRGCSTLTSVKIPDAVTSIEYATFSGCSALASIKIPDAVTSIEHEAFHDCSTLTSIKIPDVQTFIGFSTFQGCSSLASVEIPDTVTSIGDSAFKDCSALTSVKIPDAVITIGNSAFEGCTSLISITIPSGVTSVGKGFQADIGGGRAFAGCSRLKEINVAENNAMFCSIDGVLFDIHKNLLIQYPGGKEGSYVIPDRTSIIGEDAFSGVQGLTSLTITDNIDMIDAYRFGINWYERNGFRALKEINSLEEVTVTEGNKKFSSQGGVLFNKNKSELLLFPKNKSGVYTIPDDVSTIGEFSFSQCYDLTKIVIPKSVDIISAGAFYKCTNLKSVIMSDGVCAIEYASFNECNALTDIYYTGTEEQWNDISGHGNVPASITIHYEWKASQPSFTSSLVFDESSYTAKVGETIALSATFLSSRGPTDMQWFCDNTEAVSLVAETSVAGPFPDKETTFYVSHQMVGNKAGTYEITLTASGLTATTTLTITDDAPPNQENAIHLSKNAYSLQADEIGSIVANWKYPHANASTIHWSVSGNAIKESPEAIAEPVFADGSPAPQDSFRFKGVHTGQATITATLPSGESDSCVVTVEDVNPYYLVIIPYSGVSVQEGDKTEIQATVCATDTQRAVDDRELEAVTSIVWESSNGDFVAFDKDGKTREESDHISHGLFGNKADAVKIYGRARGKSEVSCTVQINGYTISKSVTASVNSKETNEMIKLIRNWTDAYAKYITALEKYLEKDSEKDNAIPVDEMGKLLMEADFNHPETRLVQFTNSVLNQRAATGTDQLTMRTYVYQGVAQFLADKGSGAFPKIKAKDVSDVVGFASEIATAACNYVDTAPYLCTFYHNGEAVSVKIQGISAGAAHMREILYNDQKVADMISSVDEIMAVLIDYGTKLCELSREVIKQAYKEALKELFSKDISGLMEESVKKRVEDSLGNYIGRFSETGINDVVKDVQYCFDYYGHLKTVFSASASDPKSILDAMGKLDFKSNPANVKDYSVKRAMKSIKKAGSSLEDFLKKAVVKDGGDYGQFLTDVYDIMFHFHCPITIAVYSGDVQVGLLSEDDIWYDSNVVYIEQYGEEKNVYAHSGTALRFEVVGTDEGTLDYIVEEFQDGKSIQRLNYYDINLYEGKTVSISVSGATITEDDAVLSESDGRPIFCDETLTSNDYEAASVLISSLASPRRGGQVQGCGSYVRGDRIALRAIPENGFLFDGWRNDDGELVSLDRVYEFTAREDVSLTAMFAEDAEEISEPDSVAITSATLDKADGLKVCAAIQCPKNVNATVYCAFYKSNGQMVSVEAESLQTGENDLTLPVDDSIIAIAKLFVLDEQFIPQCQCAAIEIS